MARASWISSRPSGLKVAASLSQNSSAARRSSSGRMVTWAVTLWRMAFRRDAALPASVFGPVERWELRRLASMARWERTRLGRARVGVAVVGCIRVGFLSWACCSTGGAGNGLREWRRAQGRCGKTCVWPGVGGDGNFFFEIVNADFLSGWILRIRLRSRQIKVNAAGEFDHQPVQGQRRGIASGGAGEFRHTLAAVEGNQCERPGVAYCDAANCFCERGEAVRFA